MKRLLFVAALMAGGTAMAGNGNAGGLPQCKSDLAATEADLKEAQAELDQVYAELDKARAELKKVKAERFQIVQIATTFVQFIRKQPDVLFQAWDETLKEYMTEIQNNPIYSDVAAEQVNALFGEDDLPEWEGGE